MPRSLQLSWHWAPVIALTTSQAVTPWPIDLVDSVYVTDNGDGKWAIYSPLPLTAAATVRRGLSWLDEDVPQCQLEGSHQGSLRVQSQYQPQ